MKSSKERIQNIKSKVKSKRDRRVVAWTAGSVACALVVLTVVCSLPLLGQGVPNPNAYKKDSYFPLIEKINACYHDDRYSIFDSIGNLGGATSPAPPMDDGSAVTPDSSEGAPNGSSGSNKYEETTQNQVEGVIEGDVLKRSSTHAFYLKTGYSVGNAPCLALDVYELNKDKTVKVCEYYIRAEDDTSFGRYRDYRSNISGEMLLNDDATRATVIAPCVSEQNILYTAVISLDVSNPAEITEIDRVYVSGSFLSVRKTQGKLLVMTKYSVGYIGSYGFNSVDYDKKDTFVPRCGDMSDDGYVPMDDIYLPDNCLSPSYTVLALLDEQTLEVVDTQAALSYALDVYVSKDYIVISRNERYCYDGNFNYGKEISQDKAEKLSSAKMIAVCEFVAVKYSDGFEVAGETGVEGFIKDRYSMDEKDGVLRMFTTTRHKDGSFVWELKDSLNVSLYCVDLATMKVVASKERFAPAGDEVKSVRFDKDKAYVCTARGTVDPVFYFDLSNLDDITFEDTGEIAGFSVNLVKFNDLLLGIGRGEKAALKVELYKESNDPNAQNGVESVAVFEKDCGFSSEYKAHFVNAEHCLVGLQVIYYGNDDLVTNEPTVKHHNRYLLLRFDETAEKFEVAFFEPFDSHYDYTRAFYEHDGVYVFGQNGFLFVDLA